MRTVRPLRSRVTGALAVLALGGSLAACGSDGSGSSQAADAPSSSTASDATPSPDPTASDSPATLDDGGQVAVADFVARIRKGLEATDTAHMDVTMSGTGGEMTASGDVDYTVTPPNMSMTMKLGPQTMTMLLLDKVMYVQSAQQGDKFVKYDLDDPNNPLGPSFTQQLDPNSSMEALTQAVSSVSSQGSEKVGGQQLDHYAMTIDPSKLANGQTAGTPTELVVDVWLDDQDRMVQTKMDLGAVKYLATLSNLDAKVTLEAPPESKVITPPAG